MAITEVEKLAGIQLGDGAAGDGAFLSILENGDPALNQEMRSIIPAGHTHPTHVSVKGGREEIPWSCGQLAAVIGQLGNFGVNTSTTKLFYRLVENMEGPAPAADLVHTVFTASKARSYIMSVAAGHRREAFVRGRTVPLKDGANPPLLRSGSAAITSDPIGDSVYQLGSLVYPGGVVLEGCDDFDMALNPNQYELSERSDKHTIYCAGNNIVPVGSFVTSDRDVWDLNGTDASGFKVHFVRGKNLEDCYLDNELQHIRCTLPQCVFVVQGKTSEDPSRYRVEIGVAGDQANAWIDNPVEWLINVAVDNT